MSTILYLARHGETVWNLTGRMQGRGDSPLTERGVEQARRLGERLRLCRLDAIFTSPLPRALHTAELVRGERAVPIIPDVDLCEMAFGPWEGLSGDQIRTRWAESFENFWRAPQLYAPPDGGETYDQVQARMLRSLKRITNTPTDGAALIISHGAALKVLLAHIAGRPTEQIWGPPIMQQASLSIIEIEDGIGRLVLECDTSFLPAAAAPH